MAPGRSLALKNPGRDGLRRADEADGGHNDRDRDGSRRGAGGPAGRRGRAGGGPRSELIFALDGSGQPGPKRYRLKLQGSESVQTPIVSTTTGRAEAGTIVGVVKYSLENLDGTKIVTEGVATSTATYDRSVQRFASLRAARDAEIRLASVLADQIKTRLASVLSAKP